ncbi:MAG: SUMF1/EgtB/PvdO family nonheme iron enzyme [Bacteroidales bacterium]|nr:SUMF1/EgtB/PvdO family nonheme iron enzyme [Bacteroidales bacterium]
MKRFFILIISILAFSNAIAQNISVKSFQPLPMDMTASSLEGKRIDQNGQIAALIKVMTTETGFVFEGGTLGIVDSQQRVGEIWVWVPRGLRKITILHQQLGGLRDYRFPVEIEAERTYEMVLTTGKVKTIVEEEVRQQYLAFQLTPANAILEVNDELWTVEADGSAMKYVNFGTYTYRVRASDYITDAGAVTVDDPNNAKIVTVTLKPDFAEITLKVDSDAEIWVNNEKKGVRTWTGPLGKGDYRIECKKAGHETTMVSQTITKEMNGKTITLPAPIPVYGSLMIESSPNFCKLYIDGNDMGTTPKSINEMLIGEHEIKLIKEGYAEYTGTVTVSQGERKQVKATLKEGAKDEEIVTVNGVSFTMKLIKGGTFQMGDANGDADEKPVHDVTVSSFYMGETEVTQALWKAVMGNNPSFFKGDNLPVECVNWNDCQTFIRKLNQLTGKNFRLPTEAEWEFAARGGTQSSLYNGESIIVKGKNNSPNLDALAWYAGNCGRNYTNAEGCDVYNGFDITTWREKQYADPKGGTHPVKKKQPNANGLYDMLGNVWEWCSDWYSEYNTIALNNPSGPSFGSARVLRGDSWRDRAINCRVSFRIYYPPTNRGNSVGFRLALPTSGF